MIPGLSPHDLGMPEKFQSWREGQFEGLDRSLLSTKRFIAHSMPVGLGKTGLYVAYALLTSKRACILTTSKGLQDQVTGDFQSIGLIDMRGRNNYPCHHSGCRNCEEGQHFRCDCDSYESSRTEMLNAKIVTSNYKYFMLSHLHGRGMGEFDLFILDEAHSADQEVCEAMAVELSFAEAQKIGVTLPRESDGISIWCDWAKRVGQKCITVLAQLELTAKSDKSTHGHIHPSTAQDQKFWTSVSRKCISILRSEGDNEWVVERIPAGYRLEPVWAHQYSQEILFMKIPKIMLLSATMVRKTLNLLGIPPSEVDYYEYPSSFPARRSPVYLWGPCRVDHKILPEFIDVWLARIDNIIRHRQDRNGIIHTISYDRSRLILDRSEFSPLMIAPGSGKDTARAIEDFKSSPPPSILVSPAITTGYDFPGPQAQYNLIVKVPFIPTVSKLIQARKAKDPEYDAYIVAQTIVQAHGRTMRSAEDISETFILDTHVNWFIRKHRLLFPFWFHRLIQYPKALPEPPEALPWSPPARSELSTLDPSAALPPSKVIPFPVSQRDLKQRTF